MDDCPPFPHMFKYCLRLVGAALNAARVLVSGRANLAFCLVGGRHHARKSEAAGFCYINDCVIAILALQRRYKRVLYIDIDVHHGDGVREGEGGEGGLKGFGPKPCVISHMTPAGRGSVCSLAISDDLVVPSPCTRLFPGQWQVPRGTGSSPRPRSQRSSPSMTVPVTGWRCAFPSSPVAQDTPVCVRGVPRRLVWVTTTSGTAFARLPDVPWTPSCQTPLSWSWVPTRWQRTWRGHVRVVCHPRARRCDLTASIVLLVHCLFLFAGTVQRSSWSPVAVVRCLH